MTKQMTDSQMLTVLQTIQTENPGYEFSEGELFAEVGAQTAKLFPDCTPGNVHDTRKAFRRLLAR